MSYILEIQPKTIKERQRGLLRSDKRANLPGRCNDARYVGTKPQSFKVHETTTATKTTLMDLMEK